MRFKRFSTQPKRSAGAVLTCLFMSLGLQLPAPSTAQDLLVFEDPKLEEFKESLKVQWFQPEVLNVDPLATEKQIIFSGKTKPHTRVQLRSEKVVRIEQGSHDFVELDGELLKKFPLAVDRHGLFHFQILLPEGSYQLGVVVYDPAVRDHRATRSYQLSFEVSEDGVQLAGADAQAEAPDLILRPHKRVALGMGSSFVSYRKKSSDIPMDATFSAFEYGSVHLEYWESFLEGPWAFTSSLKLQQGQARSSGEVELAEGDYLWWAAQAEALYYPEAWIITAPSRVYNIAVRFGLQYQQLPYLRAFEHASPLQKVEPHQLALLSGGLQADLRWSPKWDVEIYGRYFHPVLNSSPFGVKLGAEFAFDGSVGAIYRWSKESAWTAGVFWYSQWHQYSLQEHDLFSTLDIQGKQSFFLTNLDLRVQYSF